MTVVGITISWIRVNQANYKRTKKEILLHKKMKLNLR